MKKISDYNFVDCILVDFKVDKLINNIQIITEAYFCKLDSDIKKKIIEIKIANIFNIKADIDQEFKIDIERYYDFQGGDCKANEVYEITENIVESGKVQIRIISDFLRMDITCENYNIVELK